METPPRHGVYCGVFTSKVADLVRQKSLDERRTLTLKAVAEESGVPLTTLKRVVKPRIGSATLETLGKLCTYFNVPINAVIEHVPDPPTS